MGASAKRRPKVQPSTLVLPPQGDSGLWGTLMAPYSSGRERVKSGARYVDDVISRIGRMFPDMSIELFRPNGTSAVLLVAPVDRNARARGALCLPLSLCLPPLSLSPPSPSKIKVTLGKVLKTIVVMRSLFIDRTIVRGFNENVYSEDGKVTDHATTALLHYQLPQMPDVVVRSFMTPCQRCGKFLQEGLPPTWRDFRTLEAFHDTCRQ
ncbi:unnamed protein product [Coregonus sp. 'balchen']|nr:unnamed protein product [Coregonus sp. 'balchen']